LAKNLMNSRVKQVCEPSVLRRFDERGQMAVVLGQLQDLVQQHRLAGSAQPKKNLRSVMPSADDAPKGDLGVCQDVFAAGQFGWLRARTGSERISDRVHGWFIASLSMYTKNKLYGVIFSLKVQ